MTTKLVLVVTLALTVVLAPRLAAQVQTEVPPVVPGAKPVTVEHIKIHGTALEGNLEGDAIDRDVIVFLPPSYAKEKHRRYPVVYALHGFSIGAEQWTHEIHVPQTIANGLRAGKSRRGEGHGIGREGIGIGKDSCRRGWFVVLRPSSPRFSRGVVAQPEKSAPLS